MVSQPIDEHTDELETLSSRLNDRISAFESTVEYSHADRATLQRMAERRRVMRENVEAAVLAGKFWPMIKAELKRDFGSLFEDFVQFEAELDARTMRHAHR